MDGWVGGCVGVWVYVYVCLCVGVCVHVCVCICNIKLKPIIDKVLLILTRQDTQRSSP